MEFVFVHLVIVFLDQLVSHGSEVIAYAFLFHLLNHLAVYGCSREKKGRIDKVENLFPARVLFMPNKYSSFTVHSSFLHL